MISPSAYDFSLPSLAILHDWCLFEVELVAPSNGEVWNEQKDEQMWERGGITDHAAQGLSRDAHWQI